MNGQLYNHYSADMKSLLGERTLTLEKAIEISVSVESTRKYSKAMWSLRASAYLDGTQQCYHIFQRFPNNLIQLISLTRLETTCGMFFRYILMVLNGVIISIAN